MPTIALTSTSTGTFPPVDMPTATTAPTVAPYAAFLAVTFLPTYTTHPLGDVDTAVRWTLDFLSRLIHS